MAAAAAAEGVDHYFGSFKAAAGHHDILDEVLRGDPYFSPHDSADENDPLSSFMSAATGHNDGLDAFVFEQAPDHAPQQQQERMQQQQPVRSTATVPAMAPANVSALTL